MAAERESLEGLSQDLPIGTYNGGNGNYINIKQDGGIELVTSGVSQGDYVPGDQITKSTVGLSNVDNTSDLDKPISTATSAALADTVDEAPIDGDIYGRKDGTWEKISASVTEVPIHFRDTVFDDRSNSNQDGTIKQTVFNKYTVADLSVSWSNNYRKDFISYGPNTNNITIKASIEINGTIYPLYFDGVREYVLGQGEIKFCDTFYKIIDPLDEVYIYTYFDVGVGGYYPTGYKLTGSGTTFEGTDALVYGQDLVDTGTSDRPSQLMDTWGFCNILATPVSKAQPSVCSLGDSIMRAGDLWDPSVGRVGKDGINGGFMTISLIGAAIPFTNISCGGERASNVMDTIATTREPFFYPHKYVVENYGANDLFGNFETFEQLKASKLALWTYLKGFGFKIVSTTLLPYVPIINTTDNFFTEAGQTVSDYEPERLAYNNWIRNVAPVDHADLLYSVIDVDAEAGTSEGKWKEYTGYEYEGSGADPASTTSNLYDSDIPDSIENGVWDGDCYLVITGGTNFGEDPRLIGSYSKDFKRIIYFPAHPVPCDATTTYAIKRVPTVDGLHPKSGTVNLRTSKAVNTDIFR